MSIWWTLHLRREAASVPLARRFLLGAMETAGVDPDVSFELGMALTEACANAVEHAGGAPAELDDGYQVTARIDGDTCRIEVRDSGPGFPEPSPAPFPVASVGPGRGGHADCCVAPPSPLGGPVPSALPTFQPGCGTVDAALAPSAPGPSAPLPPPAEDTWPGTDRIGTGLVVGRRTDATPPAYAESGRGLHLIEALADHVQFRNHASRGAVVSFDKVLKWRDGALLKAS